MILPNKQLSGGYFLRRLLSFCARLVPGQSVVKFCLPAQAGGRPRMPGGCGAGRVGCEARPGAGRAHPPAFSGLPRRGHHTNMVTPPRPQLRPFLLCRNHPRPQCADLVSSAGGHSPCHSRTDSGVSAVTAPSARLRGAPSRSSRGGSDRSNSITNHWARRAPGVTVAGGQRQSPSAGAAALEAGAQPPRCSTPARALPPQPPGGPRRRPCRHSVPTPGALGWRPGRCGGFPRPTHSGLEKEEEEAVDHLPIPEIPAFGVGREEW